MAKSPSVRWRQHSVNAARARRLGDPAAVERELQLMREALVEQRTLAAIEKYGPISADARRELADLILADGDRNA